MEKLLTHFKQLNLTQQFAIVALLSAVFHYGITIVLLVITIILMIKNKEWKKIIQTQTNFNILSVLIGINIVISAWHRNILGMLFSFFMFLIFLVAYYIRTFISKENIYLLLKAMIVVSIVTIVYMFIGYVLNRFIIKVTPYDFSKTIFFNENYGGAVYSFLTLIAFVLFQKFKKKIYLLYILCMFLLILFAKSRGALFGAFLGIVSYYFWILPLKTKKIVISILLLLFISGWIAYQAGYLPFMKIEFIHQFVTYRIAIWDTGYRSFLLHPFIGQGQFTHLSYCQTFGTLCIEHAHNLFLELFIVYGVIGMLVVLSTAKSDIQKLIQLKKLDIHLFALVLMFATTASLHGLVDYQLFWVQPGLIFFVGMGIIEITKSMCD